MVGLGSFLLPITNSFPFWRRALPLDAIFHQPVVEGAHSRDRRSPGLGGRRGFRTGVNPQLQERAEVLRDWITPKAHT